MSRGARASVNLLILLLGAAVFLNNVDRGAIGIAAPKMKDELGLSAETYGLAFSAFFWIYAPVQFFQVGCATASRVPNDGARILVCRQRHPDGLRRRLSIAPRTSRDARRRRSISFPEARKSLPATSSRDAASPMPPSPRHRPCPAVGTLVGGLILGSLGWRWIFFTFGAVTLSGFFLAAGDPRPSATGHFDQGTRVPLGKLKGKWSLWAMSFGHALNNYSFYFLLAWIPLFLTKSRGFSIAEMTLLATIGYSVQGRAPWAAVISPTGGRVRAVRAACRRYMMIASQLCLRSLFSVSRFARSPFEIALLLSLAGVGSAFGRRTSTRMRRYLPARVPPEPGLDSKMRWGMFRASSPDHYRIVVQRAVPQRLHPDCRGGCVWRILVGACSTQDRAGRARLISVTDCRSSDFDWARR